MRSSRIDPAGAMGMHGCSRRLSGPRAFETFGWSLEPLFPAGQCGSSPVCAHGKVRVDRLHLLYVVSRTLLSVSPFCSCPLGALSPAFDTSLTCLPRWSGRDIGFPAVFAPAMAQCPSGSLALSRPFVPLAFGTCCCRCRARRCSVTFAPNTHIGGSGMRARFRGRRGFSVSVLGVAVRGSSLRLCGFSGFERRARKKHIGRSGVFADVRSHYKSEVLTCLEATSDCVTALTLGSAEAVQKVFFSFVCKACSNICSVKIEMNSLVTHVC